MSAVLERRRGKGFSSSPPLARSLSSLWKENLNPALFVSSALGFCPGFHGNWLWTPGRNVAPCGDCSHFPLPSPPLKPSDSLPCALGRGCAKVVLRSPNQRLEESEAQWHLSISFPQATMPSVCSLPSPDVGI